LFNRGKTNADLFPGVEKIHGDRERGDLRGLTNDRRWNAVIDVWANDPAIVVPIANLLAKRTDYYHFVSSLAAYAEFSKVGMDETAPTRTDRPGYGGNKARSEKALTDLLGNRVGICRPCAIMGPRDGSLSYHYWLSHLAKDQEFVAPGTGDDAFAQYVDVRDVASWIIDCVEQQRPIFLPLGKTGRPVRSRGYDGFVTCSTFYFDFWKSRLLQLLIQRGKIGLQQFAPRVHRRSDFCLKIRHGRFGRSCRRSICRLDVVEQACHRF
jgi:hypothetical protein